MISDHFPYLFKISKLIRGRHSENEFTVLFQIDTDKSDTIDFNEFVKIMT